MLATTDYARFYARLIGAGLSWGGAFHLIIVERERVDPEYLWLISEVARRSGKVANGFFVITGSGGAA